MNKDIYKLNEIKDIVGKIFDNYEIKKAILFGSYAKNIPTEKSDIDLVIDSDGKLLNINFYSVLEDLVQGLGKKVDLFEISEIHDKSKIYDDIKKEGIVIYER